VSVTVVRKYVVKLPEHSTELNSPWMQLLYRFLTESDVADDNEFWADDENFEPQVLRGAVAYWLTEEADTGNFTGLVKLDDYDIVETPDPFATMVEKGE
jgi:hypothetical protein